MSQKPKDPYPHSVKRVARRLLPNRLYRRWFGRHEDGSMNLWRFLAAQVMPDAAILDIGAYHGEYSLAAREVNHKVSIYAFEPNPISLKMLRLACENKGIFLVGSAVAEKDGAVPFALNQAQSRVISNQEADKQSISVSAVALDSWILVNDVSPSLIKIDVEGAEASLLSGAIQVLEKYQPLIICEVLSNNAGEAVMGVLPREYCYFHIDENSGTLIERSRITREQWRNHNWFLVPADKKAQLRTAFPKL